MSLITKIPPRSRFEPISVRFTATYNAITPFRYDYTLQGSPGALVNQDIQVTEIKNQSVYMLERLRFSFTIEDTQYSAAIGTNPTPLLYLQIESQQKMLIYSKPWPINDFVRDNEHVIYFQTVQKNDNLIASFRGRINQTAPMLPFPIVDGILQANLYEIKNKDWIEEYNKGTGPHTGQSLNN